MRKVVYLIPIYKTEMHYEEREGLFHAWVQEYANHNNVGFARTKAIIEDETGELIRINQDRVKRFTS